MTARTIGELTYWEQGTQLIEQREGAGRMKYRCLGADGEPIEDWQDAPSPPSRLAGNGPARNPSSRER